MSACHHQFKLAVAWIAKDSDALILSESARIILELLVNFRLPSGRYDRFKNIE